jgi:hypothetical protein
MLAMPTSNDKRRSPRQMCSDFVQVSFADQNGRMVSDTALLEDVSQQGLNISLNIPLPKGQDIQLEIDDFSGTARVRYCNIGEYSYLVGLEFADQYEWDAEKWAPRHLLVVPGEDS